MHNIKVLKKIIAQPKGEKKILTRQNCLPHPPPPLKNKMVHPLLYFKQSKHQQRVPPLSYMLRPHEGRSACKSGLIHIFSKGITGCLNKQSNVADGNLRSSKKNNVLNFTEVLFQEDYRKNMRNRNNKCTVYTLFSVRIYFVGISRLKVPFIGKTTQQNLH